MESRDYFRHTLSLSFSLVFSMYFADLISLVCFGIESSLRVNWNPNAISKQNINVDSHVDKIKRMNERVSVWAREQLVRSKLIINCIILPSHSIRLPAGDKRCVQYKPIPFFSYCANSMEILVPRGQLNDTRSESHVVFWNVRNVPDSNAILDTIKKMEREKKQK